MRPVLGGFRCDSAGINSARSTAPTSAAEESKSQEKSAQRRMGIHRIEDPQHPRGYRELRSNGEMRKLLDRKIAAQNGLCTLCKKRLTNYGDIVPDHIHPRGMGGAWRDDHPENIQAVHWWCNRDKGSSRGCLGVGG